MHRASRSLRWFLPVVVLGLALASPARAVRIASYNLLNYDNAFSTRDPHFRTVVAAMPTLDVIAVQEVQDQTALNRWKSNVLDVVEPGQWTAATYYDDASQSFNQGLYYRTSAWTLAASGKIANSPREIVWYRLRAAGYTVSAAEVTLYVMHYKAGATTSDQDTREIEAGVLRAAMNAQPAGTNMIVCGDFNMRSSTEAAYVVMTGSQADNDGRVFDPIDRPGTWYNNASFADIHTQSPRTTNLGDGGATGGMDDRFDQLLVTASLEDGSGFDVIASTYRAFGQDGLHFNNDINAAPVIPEGQAVADGLHAASDHIPVFAQFQLPALATVTASLDFGTVIVGAVAEMDVAVENVAPDPADDLDYTLVAPVGFTVPGGPFSDPSGGGGNLHTVTMLTGTAGIKAGNLVTSSNDVENGARNTAVSGTVLRHASPTLVGGAIALVDTVDWGSFEEGNSADQAQDVRNAGYNALQALLEVYDAQITGGDGRFSIVGGFSPVSVGGTPVTFTLHFDDTGATGTSDSTFTATLVFSTRDESGIPGGTDLSDLTVTLTATVQAGSATGVGDEPGFGVTALAANVPNPFAGSTRIAFSLAQAAPVRLRVLDVRGREVATLRSETLSAGEHRVSWDGRSDRGRDTPPGVYFLILETPGERFTRRMTRLR